MSLNNSNDKSSNLEAIAKINQVDGFDPSAFAVDYTDMNTGEVRKRLPVMIQMAWFRLKYPEGKIASQVTAGKDCFVATARIYPSYKDPVDAYIGEATASRGYCADKPSVSPREWAQTAAIGIALRNAGFGLQFGMVGDDFADEAPNEFGENNDTPAAPAETTAPAAGAAASAAPAVVPPVVERELTLEEKAANAMQMPCPISKYAGKTLGDVLTMDPNAIRWVAEKFKGNDEIKAGAIAICEYAAQQAAS